MGQLFNRIKNFAKSQFETTSQIAEVEPLLTSDDERLKKLIDELTVNSNAKFEKMDFEFTKKAYQEKKKANSESYSHNNTNNSTQNKSTSNFRSNPNKMQIHFETLGITPNASNDEVKLAYKKKIKEFHPDKYINANPQVVSEAQQKTHKIVEAYQKIKEIRGI
jgi:DnaJ-domain-containing protein 1